MNGRASRGARVSRGLGAAGVAVFVAAFSHVAGGGEAPGGVGLVLALAFAAVVCVSLAAKTLSLLRLSIGVGLSQIGMHLLFTVGTPVGGAASAGGGMAGMSTTGSMGGMSHGSDVLATLLGGGGVSSASAMAQAASGMTTGVAGGALAGGAGGFGGVGGLNLADCGWMWVAHLVAAVVTVWAVRRGARSVVSVIQSARMHVLRFVRVLYVERPAVRPLHRGVAAVRAVGHPSDLSVVIGRLRHRGPPVWQFSL